VPGKPSRPCWGKMRNTRPRGGGLSCFKESKPGPSNALSRDDVGAGEGVCQLSLTCGENELYILMGQGEKGL